MNEEQIKEMCNDIYTGGDWKPMIDYITNLQKENKKTRKSLEKYIKEAITLRFTEVECGIYRQRIDKAMEYIKKNTHEYKMFNKELGHFSNLTNISIDKNNKIFIDDLLKILGGDEE